MTSPRPVSLRTLGTLAVLATLCSAFAYAQSETTIFSFSAASGVANPIGIIADGHGNFFGTAAAGNGSVFELSPAAGGGWTQTTLYKFPGATGPYNPTGIVMDAAGNIFGVSSDGDGGNGLAYELSPDGQGAYTYTTLHKFMGHPDGAKPYGVPILDAAGHLYGTTIEGGTCASYSGGCGTAFELSPQSGGGWKETILHNFGASSQDGQSPLGGMVFDKNGNLYGTTQTGGFVCTDFGEGCGTVFELIPHDGKWNEKILHTFDLNDGQYPVDTPVLDSAGNLYAATDTGGSALFGVVFQLTPTATGPWEEHIIHDFVSFPTGSGPDASVTLDANGNLFVPTVDGGHNGPPCLDSDREPFGCGTVWEFKPTASGGWTGELLYVFTGGSDGRMLKDPSLVLDSQGNLYGAAIYGGDSAGDGTIFEITP